FLCKPKPAQSLNMRFVIQNITVALIPCQTDLYCFQPFCLTGRTRCLSVACPILPAISLYVGAIFYMQIFIWVPLFVHYPHLDRFQTFGFSGSSGDFSTVHPVLPSVGLYMNPVL